MKTNKNTSKAGRKHNHYYKRDNNTTLYDYIKQKLPDTDVNRVGNTINSIGWDDSEWSKLV